MKVEIIVCVAMVSEREREMKQKRKRRVVLPSLFSLTLFPISKEQNRTIRYI